MRRSLSEVITMFLLLSLIISSSARDVSAAKNAPQYSNLAVISTTAGASSVFATKWTDANGLSQYFFGFNSGSGTLVNGTAMGFGGTSNWSNTTENLTPNVGTEVQWKVYAKDVNNIWNSTHIMCAVTGYKGSPPSSQFVTIADDCYDLLAYDGTNLHNLGNLPSLFQVDAGGAVGYHGIQWNFAMNTALVVGYNAALVRYSKATGTLTVLQTGLSSSIGLNGVAWKPNDNSFALIAGDGGTLLQYNGGTVSSLSTGTSSNLKKVAWNPTGNYAIIVGDAGTVLKYSYNGGAVSPIASGVTTQLSAVDFKPDGKIALIIGSAGKVLKYTDSTGLVSSPLGGVGQTYQFQDAKFSRDGAYVLLTSQNNVRGNLVMWTASSGVFTNVSSGITNTANQIAFAPDDSYAYVTTTAGTLLKQTYGATTASAIALTNNRLRGIDFLGSPTSNPSIILTPSSGPVGTSVTVTGSGYVSDQNGVINFDGTQVGNFVENPGGGFVATFSVPSSTTGPHTVTAVGQPSMRQASATFSVTSSATTTSSTSSSTSSSATKTTTSSITTSSTSSTSTTMVTTSTSTTVTSTVTNTTGQTTSSSSTSLTTSSTSTPTTTSTTTTSSTASSASSSTRTTASSSTASSTTKTETEPKSSTAQTWTIASSISTELANGLPPLSYLELAVLVVVVCALAVSAIVITARRSTPPCRIIRITNSDSYSGEAYLSY